MARPIQYPHAHYIRLGNNAEEAAVQKAQSLNIPLAVLLRTIIEKSLKVKEEGSDDQNKSN